jgi:galactofuranosylgalactofuranosylrhamnosyl-N-acetylglucosaminyl-diphospho-decaprenol beta-1,5/1,6-galactofuranosyltransferase
MTSFLLQRLVLPRVETTEPLLYVRTQGDVSFANETALLVKGAELSFDTSFGVFAAGRWKRLTSVDCLSVTVHASGSGRIELVGVSSVIRGLSLQEKIVASAGISSSGKTTLEVPDFAKSSIGTYFVRVSAEQSDVVVSGGQWTTTTIAPREVRLSLSITTFNRQDYVKPTVAKVLQLVENVDSLRDRMRILVVDNARNIEFDTAPNAPITVVQNPNLGGAGGFARGIIHLRDEGWSTHVLLMDDDITLEPEALVRTFALFTFACDANLCIHGAMLSEEQAWMQFEAGSKYRWRSLYPLRAIGREDDLRARKLALRDAREKKFAYTAWWYTAFPISITRDNPLPVFVRGDDVAFGLMHTGKHSVTMNGVIVWHADFGLKNNPSSLFYEKRNFAIVDTLVFANHHWWHLARRFIALSFRNLFSMRYASVEYMIRGVRAYLAGPEALMATDHSALHDELRKVTEEKPGPLPAELAAVAITKPRPKAIRLIGFALAIPLVGGYILPKIMRRDVLKTAPIDSRAVGLATRYNRILYRHDRLPEGFLVQRDSRRFFSLLREVCVVTKDIALNYRRLKREYKAAYPTLVSDASWHARFANK